MDFLYLVHELHGASGQQPKSILELAADRGPTAFDLGAGSGRNYWGRPWVWSLFHNAGARPGMYGDLDMIASAPMRAVAGSMGATVA